MILILDDDKMVSEVECYALMNAGYEVVNVEDEKDLFVHIERKVPQLIILDVNVKDKKGFDILKKIRDNKKTSLTPVMFVSSEDNEFQRVKGLDAGADEFMTKPFGILEFLSRVNALLRRLNNIAKLNASVLTYDKININENSREVFVDGKICPLTYKEYELLKYMITNKGIVLSREKMVENVWGFDFQGESRTVDMHIKSLRCKLGEFGSYIKTVRNVGYKLCS
ncbi:MAG: response regulator transcription factor [Lachnospiraceae bacterium]|nr:response regulator transcription factor [Lachnospiraceae bacterium]